MAYVGNPIDTQNTFQSLVGKRFNGDGSTTDFTLDVAPGNVLDIEVFVGNVRQDPNSAYTVSGTTLSFTGAPPSGTNNIYVVHQAKSVGTIDVPALGVSTASIQADAITEAKIADDAVESEHLNNNVISGQTELAATPADTDELLISDAGTIKRIDFSHIKASNAPAFLATVSSDTNISDDTATLIPADNEVFDSDNAYTNTSSNYKFTPQTAGKYLVFVYAQINASTGQGGDIVTYIYKNGSALHESEISTTDGATSRLSATAISIVDMNGSSDFIQGYVVGNVVSGTPQLKSDSNKKTRFGAFRIIT